jgi:asparagine synthetase B (glutamine-hydrolysing)
MCGIVGYVPEHPSSDAPSAFTRLFQESRVRGLHACGLAQPYMGGFHVVRAHEARPIECAFDPARPAIAHARYSLSGDWQVLDNNQPIVAAGMALAFNGVISMATKPEFEAEFGVQCEVDNDGEVFLRCLQRGEAPQAFLARLAGSFAGVWLEDGVLCAARNERRPLWRCVAYGAAWWASTRDIFRRAGFPWEQAEPLPACEVQVA